MEPENTLSARAEWVFRKGAVGDPEEKNSKI